MQLVILAAGHGRRFGGLKQLAAIGPSGEAIMDYTASAAHDCEFDGVVLVVRPEITAEILAHVRRRWPRALEVEFVCQSGIPGTAAAVFSARPVLDGPFAVANADDLYGTTALAALASHSPSLTTSGAHVLVGYKLVRTVLTSSPVTRGLCQVAPDGSLEAIVEQVVELRGDGNFAARPVGREDVTAQVLSGQEPVSMNLWGFAPRMLDHLEKALDRFDPATARRRELILPDVINQVVSSGRDKVQVIETNERCIGITHQDDVAIVREEVALQPRPESLLKSFPSAS